MSPTLETAWDKKISFKKSNQIKKITRTFAAGTAHGEGGMSGRSLCTQRVPRKGTRCDNPASLLREVQRASPQSGSPPGSWPGTAVTTTSTLNIASGEAQSKEFRRFGLKLVWRQLPTDGSDSGSSASPAVCHRLCSAFSDANGANNVIVAIGFSGSDCLARLRVQRGRMATSNGVTSAEEERE